MKPVELSRDELKDRISSGQVIHEGDTVRIVTDDGKTHEFEVTAVSDESIGGSDIDVPKSKWIRTWVSYLRPAWRDRSGLRET